MRIRLAACIFLLGPAISRADWRDKVLDDIEAKRFPEAVAALEGPVAAGDPVAQFLLAGLYMKGQVPAPPGREIALLTSSAKSKYQPAQFTLCMRAIDPLQIYAWCEVIAGKHHRYSDKAKQRATQVFAAQIAPKGPQAIADAQKLATSYVWLY